MEGKSFNKKKTMIHRYSHLEHKQSETFLSKWHLRKWYSVQGQNSFAATNSSQISGNVLCLRLDLTNSCKREEVARLFHHHKIKIHLIKETVNHNKYVTWNEKTDQTTKNSFFYHHYFQEKRFHLRVVFRFCFWQLGQFFYSRSPMSNTM